MRSRAVVLSCTLLVATLAYAQPATAVDSITGTVTDSDTGNAVEGVSVTASDPNTGIQVGVAFATAADGTYAIVDLPDGDYVVKFAKAGYVGTWYGGYYSFDDAVNDGSFASVPGATGIDESLGSDAITGTVTDNDGNGIADVALTVYDENEVEVADGTTATDGTYSIAMGADGAGDYVVKFSVAGYVDTWYGGYYSFDDAVNDLSFASVPGASGIDESLGSDAITGTVTDNDGNALTGVTVTAQDPDTADHVGAAATTTSDGSYSIATGAAGAGDYVVKFSKAGYLDTWYGGYDSFGDAVDASSFASVPGASGIDESLGAALAQSITFAVLADRLVSASPFTLSASASSGLTVAFSSITVGVCTVSGATATVVTAGTCTIRASQAGNGSWAAAATVDRSFAVTSPPPERDDDDDDTEPIVLPGRVRPDEVPLILMDRAVMIGAGGVVTRAVQLTSGSVSVFMPAGVVVTGPQGPSSITVHPPVPRDDVGAAGFSITTSLGDDVTFDPPISVTLGLPGAEASIRVASPAAGAGVRLAEVGPSLYVPVGIAADGAISCLVGADHEEAITFEISRPGTYALRGPERPGVNPNAPAASIAAGAHSRWAGQSASATVCPGQLVDLTVLLANTGTVSWVHGTAAQLVLGTSGPPGSTADYDAGVLYAPLYGKDRLATTAERVVDPGAIGTFSFRLRAPATSGPYLVRVRPVVEGIAWLEDEGIYLELQIR